MATYLLPTAKAWCWALAETCPQPLRHHVTWTCSSWTDVIWHTKPWIWECAAIFRHQVQMACMRGTWADAGFSENSHWVLVYHIFHRSTVWTFSEILENCSSFWMWFLRSHFHFSELFRIAHLQYRRPGFNPWVGKIPWRWKHQPTPVFWTGNSMDRGSWQATVHGVTKGLDTLSDFQSVSTSLTS